MPEDAALRLPASSGELFRVFAHLALRGFGGVLPLAHRALVEEQRWLSGEEFVELLAIAQVLPGPNIVNLALIYGERQFGWRGAVAAAAGLLALPLALVLALAVGYRHFAANPAVAGALRGMGAVAAGLVISTAVKLVPTLKTNPLGMRIGVLFAVASFVAVAVLRLPLVGVVLALGGAGMALAWRRLARVQGAGS